MIGRLQLKVLLAIGVVVCLVLAGLVVTNLGSQQRNLTENVVAAAVRVSDATYAGLALPMEAGDGPAIAQQLAQSARAMPGVEIYLLDTEQNVAFASAAEISGHPLAQRIGDPKLIDAVTRQLGPGAEERSLRLSDTPPTILRPIRNAEACHHCHGQSRPVLGALMVRQTVDEVGDRLSRALWLNLAAGAAGCLCIIGLIFVLLSALVLRPLTEIGRAVEAVAAGDLSRRQSDGQTHRLARRLDALLGEDEIRELSRGVEAMTASLREILEDIRGATGALDREALSALAVAAQQSSMAKEQYAAVQGTSAVVAQIAQTSKISTEHADSVSGVCDRSEETALAGQRAVTEAMAGLERLAGQVRSIAQSITGLAEQAQRIADIVTSVEDLSDRSALLALNAAIEAAHAGEQGLGFAVVATEVRNLSAQSKEAAGQVRRLLSEVLASTRAAVTDTEEGSQYASEAARLAQSAGQSITGMTGAMRESSSAAKQIATNARQQTAGVEQIVAAVAQLSAAADDAVDGSHRVEAVAQGLEAVSKKLTGLVGRFKA